MQHRSCYENHSLYVKAFYQFQCYMKETEKYHVRYFYFKLRGNRMKKKQRYLNIFVEIYAKFALTN